MRVRLGVWLRVGLSGSAGSEGDAVRRHSRVDSFVFYRKLHDARTPLTGLCC